MITPSLDDFENATDEQIIDAYLEDGLTEAIARAYLAIIRNPDSRFAID